MADFEEYLMRLSVLLTPEQRKMVPLPSLAPTTVSEDTTDPYTGLVEVMVEATVSVRIFESQSKLNEARRWRALQDLKCVYDDYAAFCVVDYNLYVGDA